MSPRQRVRLVAGSIFVVVLIAMFIEPLLALIAYAATSDLNSHILLVPFISAYLLWIQRKQLPLELVSSPSVAMIPLVIGLGSWMAGSSRRGLVHPLSANDSLALLVLAFVALLTAGGFFFLGRKWMAEAAFPVAFLIFMVPLPDRAAELLETGSKLASAEAADWFFRISGTPVLRDGVVFQLPGIVLEVAQECSGIRSSWVLLLTGLLASHLFLQSPWSRAILVAFVIPLGILRNGFRIMVIGLLCVHVGPHMIHSAIHRRGGPVFFALSLIPLALLLWWLRRGERGVRK